MTHSDFSRTHPLGDEHIVRTADGRALRTMVSGSGPDLVVLEAGLGASGYYWGETHRALSAHVRVVAYDRAGYGTSTPDGFHKRDLARLAEDLGAVVDSQPHERLVLVGHSWGGPLIREYAARRIDSDNSVHGLVLVDQTDEHAPELYTSNLAKIADAVQTRLFVPLARTGILKLLIDSQLSSLPRNLRVAASAAVTNVTAARAIAAENSQIAPEMARLALHSPSIDPAHLTVISGGKDNVFDRAVRKRLVAAHRLTVAMHPGARHVFATQSGHMIPVTQPDLIARETLALLDK